MPRPALSSSSHSANSRDCWQHQAFGENDDTKTRVRNPQDFLRAAPARPPPACGVGQFRQAPTHKTLWSRDTDTTPKKGWGKGDPGCRGLRRRRTYLRNFSSRLVQMATGVASVRDTPTPTLKPVVRPANSPQTDSGRFQVFSGLSLVCRSASVLATQP